MTQNKCRHTYLAGVRLVCTVLAIAFALGTFATSARGTTGTERKRNCNGTQYMSSRRVHMQQIETYLQLFWQVHVATILGDV